MSGVIGIFFKGKEFPLTTLRGFNRKYLNKLILQKYKNIFYPTQNTDVEMMNNLLYLNLIFEGYSNIYLTIQLRNKKEKLSSNDYFILEENKYEEKRYFDEFDLIENNIILEKVDLDISICLDKNFNCYYENDEYRIILEQGKQFSIEEI